MTMKELVSINPEVQKQSAVTVAEWELMTGKEMREYLTPLSWKERADFTLAASEAYIALPWDQKRELKLQSIEKLEKKETLSLNDKLGLAFRKGSIKIGDWLHVRFGSEKTTPMPSFLSHQSPYLMTTSITA